MNDTPWSMDACLRSRGSLELEAALLALAPRLAVLSIGAGGSTDEGMLVSGDTPRRVRIWRYGALWMIRPEARQGSYWYFVTDAGEVTTDPRRAERAACDDVDTAARLAAGWLVDPLADWAAERGSWVVSPRL